MSKSKDAAARGMVGGKAVAAARAKGFVVGDKTYEDIKANEAPVMSEQYRPFDAATFDAYEPFSAEKFSKGIGWDNYLSKKDISVRQIKGKDILKEEISFDPTNMKSIETISKTNYDNNKGFRTHIEEIAKNPTELQSLNPIFYKYKGKNIETIDDVATAFTISLSPYKLQDKQVGTNVYYSAGAKTPTTEFNPEVYVGSMLQSGLPLNESNVKDILSQTDVSPLESNTVLTKYPNSVVIAALPQELASKYVQKVGKGTYYPDIILMDKTNQNIILGFENNGKLNFQVKPRNVVIADVTAGAGDVATKKYYTGLAPKTQPTQQAKKTWDSKTGTWVTK